ncbi:LytR C-terminal domain-containing protein [Streptomyces sp. TLI_171]|uniref:LytR C-terminal domain-containing protein n=1 Tax=Streptomyces sp. TLI_171 TaxID=1938859 RepID=UPI000C19D825|nr:LytR C-terminal domain-containing protein [Streptomyces sp. TLI_171]RKE20107.1 LytR cell envelope-related transcriptional attenuator [Streptomyces sp. TLI_171]
MSMLTPRGLKGKQYRVTGNAYPRLGRPTRRGRRVALALGGVLILGLVSVGGVQLYDVFTGKTKHAGAQACAGVSGKPLAAPENSAAASTSPSAAGSPAASGAPAPAPSNTAVPQPAAVTVNVYNATDKAGLAARTADELRKRGFVVGKVGNAPAALDKKVPGAAQVVSGPGGLGAATLLVSQVATATSTEDTRADATVDLVIGDTFTALADPTQAAAALAELTKPSPTPEPGHC